MLQFLGGLVAAGYGKGLLYFLILAPLFFALATILIPPTAQRVRVIVFITALAFNLLGALSVVGSQGLSLLLPWGGFEINFNLLVYDFSSFILLCLAVAALLVGIYATTFQRGRNLSGSFLCYYLLTVALANGALLANHLLVLLFFWEGLLITLFAMILNGNKRDTGAALKALILGGVADLLLMLGIAVTFQLAGTFEMDVIEPLPIEGLGTLGFVCMALGALGKAGAMPFHSWIPDAAQDAPLPFLAFIPGALEKLLGIYLLVRVTTDFYVLTPGSGMSTLMMVAGALTILLAVGMALIQKDMKRLLAYHAISQVGYMVLGVGTATAVGLVGALFHMLNNAIYKSCLFLCAGAVEMRVGSTDLREFGGLRRLMPITTACFLVAAFSIAGLPPFNGFFSKELIFDAALEGGVVFYIAALLGAFMTAASFLKMGHAAFFGPLYFPGGQEHVPYEVPPRMFVPMGILAMICLIFGVANVVPVGAIQRILGEGIMQGHDYGGLPHSWVLVAISVVVLGLAVLNHFYGYHRTGEAVKAVDHIHYLPGLHQVYNCAEKKYFDPYEWLMMLVKAFSWTSLGIDRVINWVYDVLIVKVMHFATQNLSNFNNGHSARYMAWTFAGMIFILIMFIVLI